MELDSSTGLGTKLRALVDQLDGAVEAQYYFAGLDYRPRFTPVIRHLERSGASTLRSIADAIGVSHSAISQTIAEMSRRNLVTKRRGQDGREQVVTLSRTGLAMLPALRRCWEVTDAAARDLSDEIGVDLEALITVALASLHDHSFGARMERARAIQDSTDGGSRCGLIVGN